jgi:hypothetical protein
MPVGGLPDRLRDGRDAMSVPINDPGSIGQALKILMDDTERTLVSSAQRTLARVFRHNPVAQFDEQLRATT